MKTKTYLFYIVILSFSLSLTSCTDNSIKNNEKEGNWEGCVVGAYTFDIDGRIFPKDAEQRIKELEELLDHEVGSIAWFPTWADPFPTEECELLRKLNVVFR